MFRPDIVTTVTVSATPTDNPASSLTVTGSLSGVEIGQRIIITDSSGNIVNHGTVRKAVSGQTLYIAPVSIGDSGYVSPIKRAITSGDTITIYKDRPLWGDYSRIAGGTFRKKWDIAYTDENEDAPPIANAGTSQSTRVDIGNSATFTLPRSGSNDSFAFGSKTISSYSWSLPTGVTLGGGYNASDSVIEVTASQGQHVISLTVTDSNGKTHTAYTYLFVSDGTNYLDLFEQYSATVNSDSQDRNGRTVTFTVTGDNIASQILPGAYVHLQHDSKYNGTSLTTGVDVDVFVGYVTDIQPSHNGDFGQATITAVSPYIYLKSVFMPGQVVTEVSNPSTWAEVNSTLSNPRGVLCYVRWQCQNLFAMHDVDANGITTPRKYSYEFNSKTVSGGLDVAAQAIVGNVGSASDGTLVLRHNPVYEDNTFRNALAVGMTFGVDDIIAPLEYPISVLSPYADIRAGAFAYNGGGASGVKAWYGAKRWAQGSSETVLPDFTVNLSDGLDGVLEKVGHMAADLQYPDEQPLRLNRNINVIDPAYMIWYRLNVSSDYDPSGNGWDNVRILPTRVNRSWDNDTQTLTIETQVKRETFGQKADEWVIGSGNTVMSGSWVADLGIGYEPTNEDFSVLSSIGIAYNTVGDLAITQNFTDAVPNWQSLNPLLEGAVCDVCFDYNSAFFTGGFVLSDPLSIYVATISGTTIYVYRLYDIKAVTYEFTELATYTMADSSCTTEARIQCSKTTGTLAVVAWHDQTGIEFGRTTDGGSTWSSKANVGSAGTDTNNDNAPIGLYIDGVNQLITGFDGTDYDVYHASTAGGSFSKLANSESNTAPNAMITGDENTTLYVSTDNNGTGSSPDTTIDFDGGYGSYTVGSNDANSDGDTGTGNDGNAAYAQKNTTGLDTGFSFRLNIEITFASVQTISQIDFDWYHDSDYTDENIAGSYPLEVDLDTTIRLYNATSGGSLLYDSGDVTRDTATITSMGDPFTGWTYNDSWQTAENSFSPVANVRRIYIQLGFFNYGGRVEVNSNSQLRLDNIKTYATAGGSAIDPALYKVTTYTTTDSWTDVTPDTDYIPKLPYGASVDLADTDNVELVATDDSTPKYFQSGNAASSWTDNGASDYRSVKRVGDVIIYGGVSTLDLSLDSGTTVEDKTGNLDVVFNPTGTIKNVLVLA